MFWHCWLGDRKGIRPVKKLDVALLVMIWLEFCMTYSSCSPVVTTTSIIFCFKKHRLTQVHLKNAEENLWGLVRQEILHARCSSCCQTINIKVLKRNHAWHTCYLILIYWKMSLNVFDVTVCSFHMPSVVWYCWLDDRMGIRPVRSRCMCGLVI